MRSKYIELCRSVLFEEGSQDFQTSLPKKNIESCESFVDLILRNAFGSPTEDLQTMQVSFC